MSAVDVFCTQTYEDFKRATAAPPSPRAKKLAYALGAACIVLLFGFGTLARQMSGVERDRDALALQLRSEQAARAKVELAVKDAEFRLANVALETQVRRDIVDERMVEQQGRAAELEKEAEEVRVAKLVEADCVTPRSVIAAADL